MASHDAPQKLDTMPAVFAACATKWTGIVYDVGARTGDFSVIAAKANKHNFVYAFEPDDAARAGVVTAVKRNRCASRVNVQPLTVGRDVSLDSFERLRAAARVTIIRLDSANSTAPTFRGATGLLKTHRPIVFFEAHAFGDAPSIEWVRRAINYVDVQLHSGRAEFGARVEYEPGYPHHMLVPFEKLAEVCDDVFARCGVETVHALLKDDEAATRSG